MKTVGPETKREPRSEEPSELYQRVKKTQPRFASSEEARAAYGAELQRLASAHEMTSEKLLESVDDSDLLSSEERRQVMRLANMLAALSK